MKQVTYNRLKKKDFCASMKTFSICCLVSDLHLCTIQSSLQKLKTLEEELVKQKGAQPWLRDGNSLPELTKAVEKLEKLAGNEHLVNSLFFNIKTVDFIEKIVGLAWIGDWES